MMTKHNLKGYFLAFVAVMTAQFVLPGLVAAVEPAKIVQAQAILTVSESKRLIAQAVKEMPIVKNALANCVFRGIPDTHSGRIRTPIPFDSGQSFQSIPDTL